MDTVVYIYNLKNLQEGEADNMLPHLPLWRRQRVADVKNATVRTESIVAGALLVMALRERLGAEPEDKYFIKNENGLYDVYAKIHFNITHSGDYVAVALSDEPVGIDIEHKEDKEFRISNRMFSQEDKDYIAGNQKNFRNVWTIKESFLKCVGIGVTAPLSSFTTDYRLEKVGDLPLLEEVYKNDIISRGFDLKGKKYEVITGSLGGGDYSFSVCSTKKNFMLDIKWVEVLL